ncbi:CotG/ExsB N-terminal domain-containing protein [Aeribacillus pallidus]|uniref:Uncharacterized protein n=1 Tax=Aeribacillus pallidus TaxID=33936 RepID=A0A223E968_9BACI|nr:hypothetical protein [Aeribacillus pallidus]ASS91750.1 hypothetical protein AP3564_17225 [Aeribacillus pallidus]
MISEKVIKEAFHRGGEKGLKHFYFQELEGRRRSDKTSGSRDFKHTKRKKFGALKTEICGSCVFK